MTVARYVAIPAGAVLAILLNAQPAAGQIQVGTKVGAPAPTTAAGAGTYESLGRRDPFTSLIAPRRAASAGTPVPRSSHGLGSFMLADVTVTGITRKGSDRMAILQGPDKTSYVAKVKDKIADAVIKSIDAQGVVFVDVPEAGSGNRPQETRKLLRPAAGDNR
jgi:Tfp pilus assembly protein PilP